MRDNPLESTVENLTSEHAERLKWRSHKWKRPGQRGALDRFYTRWPRQIIFIEFKKYGEQQDPLQLLEMEKLMAEGFDCYVVDTVEEGRALFDQWE